VVLARSLPAVFFLQKIHVASYKGLPLLLRVHHAEIISFSPRLLDSCFCDFRNKLQLTKTLRYAHTQKSSIGKLSLADLSYKIVDVGEDNVDVAGVFCQRSKKCGGLSEQLGG
jgi:hypothetical protein